MGESFLFLKKQVVVLFYLFLPALSLCCFGRAFSRCGEWGATLHCTVRASHCSDFTCYRAQASGVRASGIVALGLSCLSTCEIFPGRGSNPCHLAGRQILFHCSTREVQHGWIVKTLFQWKKPVAKPHTWHDPIKKKFPEWANLWREKLNLCLWRAGKMKNSET